MPLRWSDRRFEKRFSPLLVRPATVEARVRCCLLIAAGGLLTGLRPGVARGEPVPTSPSAASPATSAPTPGTSAPPLVPAPPAPAGSPAATVTLPGAVTAALMANPTARAATQQLAQARARLAQAEAQRRFQITLETTGSGSDAAVIQPPPAHQTFGTLQNTLTIPLPIGARPRLAVAQARAELAAAQAQFDSARLSLTQDVTTTYYDLLRRQALLQIAQETLAAAQRQLSEAERRYKAGDAPDLDVLRAQVPVASAQAGLYQAENAAAVARETLNSLIGNPLDAPLVVAEVSPGAAALPSTLDEARSAALQYSPQIRSADATVRAHEAALGSARRWREPTLSLQAIDLRSNDQTAFSRENAVQATLTLPLSDGGLGRSRTREAQAVLEQARAQAEAARRTVLVTVSSAYLTAQSSNRQVEAARVAQEIAQTSYDKTVLGYRNGLFPLTDVLNAQSALNQARIAYRQALYDAAVAVSTLNNAIGRSATGSGPAQ
jgi:outer membrane protein TolC